MVSSDVVAKLENDLKQIKDSQDNQHTEVMVKLESIFEQLVELIGTLKFSIPTATNKVVKPKVSKPAAKLKNVRTWFHSEYFINPDRFKHIITQDIIDAVEEKYKDKIDKKVSESAKNKERAKKYYTYICQMDSDQSKLLKGQISTEYNNFKVENQQKSELTKDEEKK